VFYPSGLTTDNTGKSIVVPPSHMMMRTLANSDNTSYPWFAPAGTRRGVVDNATSVGYVNADGEFQTISVTESVRDSMHEVKINPITFFSGAGIVNFGNLTKTSPSSALDRINVSRLAVYLRTQLDALGKPFIFEPNDELTRNEIKQAVESFLLELVGQRALYDFLVVCDETNNTPTRIDRNELYVDIAIEPIKSVEFIYIPLRIKNTGEIAQLGN
jgi:phage tail sheath protein FI